MYNTYGVTTHSEIAKKLQITTALAHKIEGDIFLKFAVESAIEKRVFRLYADIFACNIA